MSDYGVVSEPRTVRFERVLPGPIDRVWAYLTESDKRAKWLASGPMELRVGGRFELKFNQADYAAIIEPIPERFKHHGGEVEIGLVTQCDPPRLLAFTWREGAVESEVIFELMPRGRDVLLVLTHRRLGNRVEMVSVASGWHTLLGVLVEHLNGCEPRWIWSVRAVGGRRVREAHPARLIFVRSLTTRARARARRLRALPPSSSRGCASLCRRADTVRLPKNILRTAAPVSPSRAACR